MKRKVIENGIVTEVELTPSEVAERLAAQAAHEAELPNKLALAEITKLEAQITPRRLRDAVLTVEGKAWLDNQESLIATERNKLTGE